MRIAASRATSERGSTNDMESVPTKTTTKMARRRTGEERTALNMKK